MRAEISAMLALTLGEPVGHREFSWAEALRIARRERCAGLAWLRSGADIRRLAPVDVSNAWRDEALAAVSLSEFWAEQLMHTLGALDVAAVRCVVLKGLPLSQRLYGDIGARPCADLDLYVDACDRAAAHEALYVAGWKWRNGEAPGEAGYVITAAGRSALLEVHSSVLDDPLVRHLPFASPQARTANIGMLSVPAHDDWQLPAFLATHLAKHAMPPLLWFVDFMTLWESLGLDERRCAQDAARAARAHRYLNWAIARALDVKMAAREDSNALRRLGIRTRGRLDNHNAIRVAALAAGPRDALSVLSSWMTPACLVRGTPSLHDLVVRARSKSLRRLLGTRREYQSGSSRAVDVTRAFPIGMADLAALVQELSRTNTTMWTRVSGSSMAPTIRAGARVRLAPLRSDSLRAGEVVLAMLSPGRYVIHRIRRINGQHVTMRGDANVNDDPAVDASGILAMVDLVEVDGSFRGVGLSAGRRAERLVRSSLARMRRLFQPARPVGAVRRGRMGSSQ